jgi:O-antigen ligase
MVVSGQSYVPGPGSDNAIHRRQRIIPQRFMLSGRMREVFSCETCFALFLVSGRIKGLPELRSVPIDLTLLFLALTWCVLGWEIVSGRLKPLRFMLPVVLMLLFCEYAAFSVFWSSLDAINIDKLSRFLLLTAFSFFAACILGQDQVRRRRLVIALFWLSLGIVFYYLYYRYVLGIDTMSQYWIDKNSEGGDNYLEYGSHASIVFMVLLPIAVFGSWRQTVFAAVGASVALFALLSLGGRGPLAAAVAAIPLLGIVLLVRRRSSSRPAWGRLAGFGAAIVVIGMIGLAASGRSTDESLAQFHTLHRYQAEFSGESTGSLDLRAEGRAFAFRQWLASPVFGWGIGQFRVEDTVLMYPHNVPLEILMEMGLVGACLFFGIPAAALAQCWTIVRQASTRWPDIAMVLLFVISLCWELTVAGYLADDRIFFAYLGMVIGTIAAVQKVREAR